MPPESDYVSVRLRNAVSDRAHNHCELAANTPEQPLSIQKLSKKHHYLIPVNNHGMTIFSGVLTQLK